MTLETEGLAPPKSTEIREIGRVPPWRIRLVVPDSQQRTAQLKMLALESPEVNADDKSHRTPAHANLAG